MFLYGTAFPDYCFCICRCVALCANALFSHFLCKTEYLDYTPGLLLLVKSPYSSAITRKKLALNNSNEEKLILTGREAGLSRFGGDLEGDWAEAEMINPRLSGGYGEKRLLNKLLAQCRVGMNQAHQFHFGGGGGYAL